MNLNYYRAFEDKFRGSRDAIKARLQDYFPFIEPLKSIYTTDLKTIDLGCGRGEWLEFMRESGFDPYGVDMDNGMLQACRDLKFNVETKDAVSALKSLPDESQVIVSGFHIAEHLPFPDLQQLIYEAHRVLKPGGLLILETPNSENIIVGTFLFYSDPTHQKPIHPQILIFLSEFYGFLRVRFSRLHESEKIASNPNPSLWDVITGASPDYSVIAQKAAPHEMLIRFDSVFYQERGLPLQTLAERFDKRIQNLEDAQQKINSSYLWRMTAPLRYLHECFQNRKKS